MLTKFDDYPIHQTWEPLSNLATSDRNAYHRYYNPGYCADFFFGIAFGIYPNREIMDCSLSIARANGIQDSFHGSRRCPRDHTDTRVGPFTLQIVEPMRVLRITLDSNSSGITADLTWRARTIPHEEQPDIIRQGHRVVMSTTRFLQFGTWEGHITVDGRRHEVDPAQVYGCRDRSWGWRDVGSDFTGLDSFYGGTPDKCVFGMWVPIHWDNECTQYSIYEGYDGQRWKQNGQIFPAYPTSADFDPTDESGFQEVTLGEHRVTFQKGSRYLGKSEFDLIKGGDTLTIEVDPLVTFQYTGMGYWHPEWGQGIWKGEEAIGRESWDNNKIDRLAARHVHVGQFVRARMGDRVGQGHLEQMILGPHKRYGLVDFTGPPR